MSEQVEGLLLVFKRLIGKVKSAPQVTSAALQLDVLADMNIFLEKCPFLTTLPFMQETQKWQDSQQTDTLTSQFLAHYPVIWPQNLLVIPKFTMYLMSSFPLLKIPFQWVGMPHCWHQDSYFDYRIQVTKLSFEGTSATPSTRWDHAPALF